MMHFSKQWLIFNLEAYQVTLSMNQAPAFPFLLAVPSLLAAHQR